MNIAIFSDEILPSINGITIHVHELCTRLTEKNHNVVLYAPKPISKEDIKTFPYPVKYIQSLPLSIHNEVRVSTPFSLHTFIEMKDHPPDIIHFHTPFTIGFQGILHAKLFNLPLVGTFHTYFMEAEYLRRLGLHKVKLDSNEIINKVGWNYARFFFNKADVVISPSHITKSDLIKNGVKSKIQVISNGIDLHRKPIQTRYNLPEKYFLYVGRLSVEKSIDKVILAFHEHQKSDASADLVIVGNGLYKKKLEALVQTLRIKDKVHFLGMIPNDVLINSNIYPEALAFITASKSEIQPISLLEAMKYDVPIIGVKARGVVELVAGNGILCEPDDIHGLSKAMDTIAFHDDKRIRLKKRIHASIQKHDIHKSIGKIEDLYKRLNRKKKR